MTDDAVPDLRASDADRERVAEVLRDALAEGRLDMGEFEERLDAAYRARTYGELAPLTRDLPTGGAPAPAPAPTHSYSPGVQPLMSTGTPRPSGDQLRLMIMRMQAALYAKGYDPGAIDGELTESTKLALRKFQGAHGLAATGKMTTQTMNALGVALTP